MGIQVPWEHSHSSALPMFMFRPANELGDPSLETGTFALARRGQDTIKQHWNNGSVVLSKGLEEVSDESLLGSFHSRGHANDMEIRCCFSSGSFVPGLIHTWKRKNKNLELQQPAL